MAISTQPEDQGTPVPTRVATPPAVPQTPVPTVPGPAPSSLPDEALAPSEETSEPQVNNAYNNNNQGEVVVNNIDHADVWMRAGKTLVQAFLATWAVSNFAFDKGVLVGAVAAAISAAWNYYLELRAN